MRKGLGSNNLEKTHTIILIQARADCPWQIHSLSVAKFRQTHFSAMLARKPSILQLTTTCKRASSYFKRRKSTAMSRKLQTRRVFLPGTRTGRARYLWAAWSRTMIRRTRASSIFKMISRLKMTTLMVHIQRVNSNWIYQTCSKWWISRRKTTLQGYKRELCASTSSRCSSLTPVVCCSGRATWPMTRSSACSRTRRTTSSWYSRRAPTWPRRRDKTARTNSSRRPSLARFAST